MVKFLNVFSPSKTNFSSFNVRIMSLPRLSPQAVTHLRPFLQQEHTLVSHGFLEESLHLHHTNFIRVSGAATMSVIIGVTIKLLIPLFRIQL